MADAPSKVLTALLCPSSLLLAFRVSSAPSMGLGGKEGNDSRANERIWMHLGVALVCPLRTRSSAASEMG